MVLILVLPSRTTCPISCMICSSSPAVISDVSNAEKCANTTSESDQSDSNSSRRDHEGAGDIGSRWIKAVETRPRQRKNVEKRLDWK